MIQRKTQSMMAFGMCGGLLVGCSGPGHDTGAELDGVPELAAVELSLTQDGASEGTATEEDMLEDVVAEDLERFEVSEQVARDLAFAQGGMRQLNQALRAFLRPIARMVRASEPDRRVGAVRIWEFEGDAEYRFLLRRAGEGRFSWRLDARASGSNADHARIAAGRLVLGALARRGAGAMGVDLDALGAVLPSMPARGQVLLGFRHGTAGTTVAYGLRGFTPDAAEYQGVDARLRNVQLASGVSRLRLAFRGDVAASASDQQELVLGRLRHVRGEGGRSDLLIVGGDMAKGEALVQSQCWSASLEHVYRELWNCSVQRPVDLSLCTALSQSGDVNACHRALSSPELLPSDPRATLSDPQDPNQDLEAPESIEQLSDAEMD